MNERLKRLGQFLDMRKVRGKVAMSRCWEDRPGEARLIPALWPQGVETKVGQWKP